MIVKKVAKLSWVAYVIASIVLTGVLAFVFREQLAWAASVLDSIKQFFG